MKILDGVLKFAQNTIIVVCVIFTFFVLGLYTGYHASDQAQAEAYYNTSEECSTPIGDCSTTIANHNNEYINEYSYYGTYLKGWLKGKEYALANQGAKISECIYEYFDEFDVWYNIGYELGYSDAIFFSSIDNN